MESLFGFWDAQSQRRRTGGSGGGFESLKRLGHISPAVQSHLKHASPSSPFPPFASRFSSYPFRPFPTAGVPHPMLRAGLLCARRLPPHPPQRRRHPHDPRMPGRHRLPHLPARLTGPGEEPLRSAHGCRAPSRRLRWPARRPCY